MSILRLFVLYEGFLAESSKSNTKCVLHMISHWQHATALADIQVIQPGLQVWFTCVIFIAIFHYWRSSSTFWAESEC